MNGLDLTPHQVSVLAEMLGEFRFAPEDRLYVTQGVSGTLNISISPKPPRSPEFVAYVTHDGYVTKPNRRDDDERS